MKSRARDRRCGSRLDVHFPARLTMQGANPVRDLPTPVVDISSSGLRVHSGALLPTNRMANIEATCDGKEYSTRGRIVRVEPERSWVLRWARSGWPTWPAMTWAGSSASATTSNTRT